MRTKIKLLLAAASFLLPVFGWAQQVEQDATIRVGRLDNGMTYYIRHNAKDPKMADFYIAQRVGSILEEPHQRGLAHFLEHMAFNGTKHFRGDKKSLGIVPWCETVGIKFGANLNAYTSVDQTVYNISAAPVVREGVVDSCLLILHDWSHSLLLTDKEIDKERGVIQEEWRSRRSGMAVQRLMEKAMPVIYKGSKYEDCLPIGTMDVVMNFKYDALRSYYKKWYRPDLQAIIVVGDIDVDKMEQKIKKVFSPIAKAKNPAERIYYPVPDNDKMIVAIEKDAEQPIVLTRLFMKREATPDSEKGDVKYQRDGFVSWAIAYMLNQRIAALQIQPDPKFISASVADGMYFVSRTKDAFSVMTSCKQDDVKGSLQTVVGEVERVRQHGFTASELERAKAKYLSSAQRRYGERNKFGNRHYVSECVNNFLSSEPMLSPEADLKLAEEFVKTVGLDEVNSAVAETITDKNQVLTVYAPDKAGVTVPTAEQFEAMVLEAQAKKYDEYRDLSQSATSLMPVKPAAGKIVSEKAYAHGATQITLSNGVEVYVKPTEHSGDQVVMRFFGEGGTSLYPDADVPNFAFIGSAITEAGVGNYDVLTLRNLLADKNVRVMPSVDNDGQSISGQSSVKDMETMLQLTNLYFTSPRTDEAAFRSTIERRRSMLKNREASPKVVYNDSVSQVLYGNSARTAPVKLETLDKVDYKRIVEIYRERFSNAANFKMMIIGNVNIDSLKPMLCNYIASLPSKAGKKDVTADTYPAVRNANETHVFERKASTKSASVSIFYTAQLPYDAVTDLKMDVLKRVLQIAYTDSVREEKGGTYGVSVNFNLDDSSKPNGMLKISFNCDPDRYEELIPIVYNQLGYIAEQGPVASSLDKVKKYLVKQLAQAEQTNDYWNYVLYNQITTGVDFHTGYAEMVERMSGDDIKQLAKEILKQNRRLEITMKTHLQ